MISRKPRPIIHHLKVVAVSKLPGVSNRVLNRDQAKIGLIFQETPGEGARERGSSGSPGPSENVIASAKDGVGWLRVQALAGEGDGQDEGCRTWSDGERLMSERLEVASAADGRIEWDGIHKGSWTVS